MRNYAAKAGAFISLVLSDVPVTKTGIVDDTSVISSGPTVGDDSTFEMAKKVLTEYNIWDKAPKSVKEYLQTNIGKKEMKLSPKTPHFSPMIKVNILLSPTTTRQWKLPAKKQKNLVIKYI